ncbi:hypothetical protein CGLO_09492 [Colletotrichum gloeosporioides Cg-14]|uniref:Uncharacterized protein n=1 Tax=Colletotrichum gloeosporioides (strain Cg-14) TaxID=1237896 RepID=T0LHI8_COLGC|nr:hypothetical protein CGLO_09492 [Colletotrichum gloeosporioides Cg-14]
MATQGTKRQREREVRLLAK